MSGRSKSWWSVRSLAAMTACAAIMMLATSGCHEDMYHQPKYKLYEPNAFFPDSLSVRPYVEGTVARGHARTDEVRFTGKEKGGALATAFPFAITRRDLQEGQVQFNIFCSPCHGKAGDGRGVIVQRGFPAPPSYHIERLRAAPPGHFVDVMTNGYGRMFSYASRVQPDDRWRIAAYIRALQLSTRGKLADVPPAERDRLTGSK